MILLYNDTEHNKYFKVRVEPGIYLAEGAVVKTCDDVGMKAVCSGRANCKFTDTTKCLVTPLSRNCKNPM